MDTREFTREKNLNFQASSLYIQIIITDFKISDVFKTIYIFLVYGNIHIKRTFWFFLFSSKTEFFSRIEKAKRSLHYSTSGYVQLLKFQPTATVLKNTRLYCLLERALL